MQNNSVWQRACGLVRTVVEGVRYDESADAIVVSVRPNAKARSRCGQCGRRSPGYDSGDGRRRWRALDAGTTAVFIEADAPRVQCSVHGQTVSQVPWARHGVGHTRDFDAMAAWLAVRTSKSATCQLLRVAWRTIGSIITRVNTDVEARVDRLVGSEASSMPLMHAGRRSTTRPRRTDRRRARSRITGTPRRCPAPSPQTYTDQPSGDDRIGPNRPTHIRLGGMMWLVLHAPVGRWCSG